MTEPTAAEFATKLATFVLSRERYWRDGAAHLATIGGSEAAGSKGKMLLLAGVFAECGDAIKKLAREMNIDLDEKP